MKVALCFCIRYMPALLIASLCLASSLPAQDLGSMFEKKQLTSGDATLNYRLLTPENASTENPLPLVVFLHGAGERGDDNEAQLKHGAKEFAKRQDKNPCFVLVPQCPKEKRWVEVDWNQTTGKGGFKESPSASMGLVLQVVEQLLETGKVDRSRVYVTGLSMGGYGTWYAAGKKDSPFVAAAPICGGGDPLWAERYVGLPLWVFHGDADTAVPVGRSREMIEAIKEAGGSPKYTEYPGVGHDSWTQTYANDEFHEWLFSQKRVD